MIQPELPDDLHGEHAGQGWVYVVVEDPDAHYARAKEAGAEVLGEPHDAFDGASGATAPLTPRGNFWSFGTSRPEGRRVKTGKLAGARPIHSLVAFGSQSTHR